MHRESKFPCYAIHVKNHTQFENADAKAFDAEQSRILGHSLRCFATFTFIMSCLPRAKWPEVLMQQLLLRRKHWPGHDCLMKDRWQGIG